MESLTPKGSTLLEGSSSSNFQQAEGVSIPRDKIKEKRIKEKSTF
jgi:hypothetical protein